MWKKNSLEVWGEMRKRQQKAEKLIDENMNDNKKWLLL